MALTELDHDNRTGLALAVHASDPPRYYILDRRRRDLLTIGDLELANRRFAARVAIRKEEMAALPRLPLFSNSLGGAAVSG